MTRHTDKFIVTIFAIGCMLVPFAGVIATLGGFVIAFILLGIIAGMFP